MQKTIFTIIIIALCSINCFAEQIQKEAIFVIFGAGGRIDQEYNSYAQDLNKEGYVIKIYSFDPYYGNENESIDKELDVKIKECTPDFDKCEFVKDKFNDKRFLNINYTIYQDVKHDFIFEKRNNAKNSVELFRYTTGVKSNNRNGVFIKKLIENTIKNNKKIIFIDAVWCGGFQPITKQMFDKYRNKAIFIHAVHNKVQIITKDLIKLSEEDSCQNPKSILDYKYKCVNDVSKFGEKYFNENSKIYSKFYSKYNKFEDMTQEQKNEFIQSVANSEESRIKFWDTASCINDILNNSKFNDINKDVIDEYLSKIN